MPQTVYHTPEPEPGGLAELEDDDYCDCEREHSWREVWQTNRCDVCGREISAGGFPSGDA